MYEPSTSPRSVTDSRNWQLKAECRGANPGLFYDDSDTSDHDAARRMCGLCPVRRDCLQYALDYSEQHGIWGGLDAIERRKYRWLRCVPMTGEWA
ncbi:WhiB family transcriptional regulator [Rhodococcus opacus]|uniref:WhiB family transcriptional regulator n=1 Tax=Rhodococcus opacus TaxID=37919 RepID=UPI00155AD6C3|nr:WhiB family transcriptional regulator [Rhodococcus opacus]